MRDTSRREFLKTTAGVVAVTATTEIFASQVDTTGEDYKALVCVLLDGGADSLNMVIPKDAKAYANYKDAREHMAVERENIRDLTKNDYGFHPNMPKLQKLFNDQNLAVIANVGTLNSPVSHKQIADAKKGSGILGLPDSLFCHDTQQSLWLKAGNKDKGWAAKVADELGFDFINVSVSGENLLQHGSKQNAYIAADEEVGQSLDEQLEMVANLIATRKKANFPSRQIYFVKYDGWDTHDKPICESKESKSGGAKIAHLDKALGSFASSLKRLGLEDKVTTFTASDFGRVITTNRNGADHGWGGHAFAFGGAVNAGFYGKMPKVEKNSPDALANNAIVPTTSVEQYMATLVNWLGDGKIELEKVFPNLASFESKNLGFMA